MPHRRPIITLTSDFGLRDAYPAAMKAAVLRYCPEAHLLDVTHEIPPQDILCGSIILERAVHAFPASTVHLAVIDPGVGTNRRLLVVRMREQLIVCPDNGLITWSWRRHGPGETFEITWRPQATPSATFHGRDIMGPVAGMLAAGTHVDTLARAVDNPGLLDLAPAVGPDGCVIHIDQFGNATTNIPRACLPARPDAIVYLRGQPIGSVRMTYADVAPGRVLALVGSSELLEIAVRDGSAETNLAIRVGDEVTVR